MVFSRYHYASKINFDLPRDLFHFAAIFLSFPFISLKPRTQCATSGTAARYEHGNIDAKGKDFFYRVLMKKSKKKKNERKIRLSGNSMVVGERCNSNPALSAVAKTHILLPFNPLESRQKVDG